MMPLIESVIAFAVVILLASLLVTALTQFLVAVVNLRGRNLVWGLERLFSTMQAPDAVSRWLARAVATHPLLSTGCLEGDWLRRVFGPLYCPYSKVVRVEELTALLAELANQDLAAVQTGAPKEAVAWLREQLRNGSALPGEVRVSRNAALRGLHAYQDKLEGVGRWFDVLSDRMSERFAFNSRLLTLGCAVVVTFVLQLDALDVLQRMSTNEPLRRRAVAMAESVQGAALEAGEENIFERALTEVAKQTNATFREHPQLASRGQGMAWIRENPPAGKDPEQLAALYGRAVSDSARNSTASNLVKAVQLQEQLDALGVSLLAWRKDWNWNALPGMAMSVVLLSLGAPFWFNLLGQLLSLRSKIMGKEEEERKERSGKKS